MPDARNPHELVVIAIGVWGTVPHSRIAALATLGLLSTVASNDALEAMLEAIAHGKMLTSRLWYSSPTRWRGA